MNEPSPYLIPRNGQVVPVDPQAYPGAPAPSFFSEQAQDFDLHALLRQISRHLVLVIAVVAGLVTITAIKLSLTPPTYTAEATVLIKPKVPEFFNSRDENNDSSDQYDYFYKTEYEILRSRSLAAYVIKSQNLTQAFTAPTPAPSGLAKILAALSPHILMMAGYHLFVKTHQKPAAAAAPGSHQAALNEIDGVSSSLVNAYLSGLAIVPIEDTSLVKIRFNANNPDLAARVANAHAKAFIVEGLELQSQANMEAQHFLQQRLVELRDTLEKSEIGLNDYRRQNGIVPGLMSVDGKNTVILDRLTDLSRDLTAARVDRLSLEASVDMIRKHSYFSLPSVMENSAIQQLVAEQGKLQSTYAGLAKEFKPDYPPLAQLQAQLQDVDRRIAQQLQIVIGGITARYQQAMDKENRLQGEMDVQRGIALKLNDAAVQYAILQRDVDTNRQLYNSILQRIKDIGAQEGSQPSNVSIVDLAEAPGAPSAPRPGQSLMLSAVLGLAGGLGLAFLLEYLDNTLKDAEDVERYLHMPSLALVPDFATLGHGRPYGSRYASQIEDRSASTYMPKELVLSTGSFSRASEAYRVLRTRLMLSRAGEPPRTILFTSATAAEGKTVTAINTAIMFAQMGVKVLLIDADLRHPRAHEVLRLDNRWGLTEVLTGQRNINDVIRPFGLGKAVRVVEPAPAEVKPSTNGVPHHGPEVVASAPPPPPPAAARNGAPDNLLARIRSTIAQNAPEPEEPQILDEHEELPDRAQELTHPEATRPQLPGLQNDNLFLISSGSVPPNPSELLGSPKMLEILNQLEKDYDYIIIDSPPIMPVSDSIVLATVVDGVVLVVDQGRTPRNVVKAACARLDFARARIFGTVLNKVNVQGVNSYSYYDYYYYGGYGSRYGSNYDAQDN